MSLPAGNAFSRQKQKGILVSDIAQQPAAASTAPPSNGQPGQQAGGGGALRRSLGVFLRQREATVFVVALALFIYFAVERSTFTEKANLAVLLSQDSAPYIIIALGMTFLLICGEIDLSVGFTYTFAPYVMYFLTTYYGFPGWLALVFGLGLGLVVGWLNAFITVTVGVPSFITTLGTGFLLLGLVDTLSHAQPVVAPQSVAGIGHWFGGGTWSAIIWALVLGAIFHIVLTRTRWGLHTVSVGGNMLGAHEAGINVNRIKYGNFMVTGVLGALVGIINAFQNHTIDPTAGQYQPMFYAVTAAVIGGTAMLGGVGTIIGSILGALVIGMLNDGFSIMGVSANPLPIIFGGAVLIAMIANVQLARLRERGAR
jgi:simple sugar transport system permease protein